MTARSAATAAAFAWIVVATQSCADRGHEAEPLGNAKLGAAEHERRAIPQPCEHGLPAEQCTRCSAGLVEVFKELGDWCDKHGLPLSHCRECDPKLDLAAPAVPKDWCVEHAVPESMCTLCHPALVAKFVAAGDYCREHGYPNSVCPRCRPEIVKAGGEDLPPRIKPGTKVRLASAQTAAEAGIETLIATQRRVVRTLKVVGRLGFNQNRLAQISSRTDAVVVEVHVDIGDEMTRGQPLLVLASGEIGAEQAGLAVARERRVAAAAALKREESLGRKGITSEKSVEATRSELAAARGEYNAAMAALDAAGAAADGDGGQYTLTAPIEGMVVSRDAVIGKTVSPGKPILEIADLSTMWALLEVPEEDAGLVRPGQPVLLHFASVDGAGQLATVSRVGASVDAKSRTVRVRVDVPNPDAALKAGQFIDATIEVSAARQAVVVPKDSVQYAEGEPLVFVEEAVGVYVPVPVEVGLTTADGVELQGIEAGVRIVTTGAFLCKTEILKESIGAGCCDEGSE